MSDATTARVDFVRVSVNPPKGARLGDQMFWYLVLLVLSPLHSLIILNERHLRWALDGFVRYYNERRPHRTMGLREGGEGCPAPGRGGIRQSRLYSMCSRD